MAAEVFMPKLSDTMEEGRIIRWFKKVGEPVKEGEILLEVETDKADIEVEAFETGILLEITAEEGETVKVGAKIGLIGEGEEATTAGKAPPKEKPAEKKEVPKKPVEKPRREAVKSEEGAAVEEALEEEEQAARPKEEKKRAKAEEKREKEKPKFRLEEEAKPAATEEKPRREGPAVAIHMDMREAIEKFVARRAPEKITASPLARELAQQHDIELSELKGTGPDGEIVKRDVEQAVSEREKKEPGKKAAAPRIEALERAREMKATPLAVVLAEREGVDLGEVRGTGIEGRIRENDVKAYIARRCQDRGEEFRELSLMRKTIARRMTESKQTIPHFYLNMRIDMDAAVALRKKLNQGKPDAEKISFNDMVVKAAALALEEMPEVNSTFVEDKIRINKRINVGIATATPDGLVVPVIMDANKKSPSEIAREARDKAERARKRKLRPDEYSNATFTVSNLGMFGIDHFTAIIDLGQSAILAVGALAPEAVVVDGQIKPKQVMRVTLSCDHRVIDGYVGTQFLVKLREILEKPDETMGD